MVHGDFGIALKEVGKAMVGVGQRVGLVHGGRGRRLEEVLEGHVLGSAVIHGHRVFFNWFDIVWCQARLQDMFELFSIGYWKQNKDNKDSRSNTEDQALDGIAVGQDEQTDTIIFYNPLTKSYYRPPVFWLDESRLPVTNFPLSIKYDGGLSCALYRNRTDPVSEPFPPGTRVNLNVNGTMARGTIQNIPLPTSPLLNTAAVDPVEKYTVAHVLTYRSEERRVST